MQTRVTNADLRRKAHKKLGGHCACCGFVGNELFFEVDHIHNDGAISRRLGKRAAGAPLYRRVLSLDQPTIWYQLLCSNCNHGKNRNHGVCPHEEDRKNLTPPRGTG